MISVIMSCYKSRKDFLRESIESILNQTYSDFEFLIADNGVVDFDLKKFVNDFKDNRIKFIKNTPILHPALSYDRLAEIAKGEYIAIQDHDDISLPNRLKIEKEVLDKNTELQSVSGLTHIFGGRKEYDDGISMSPMQVKEELIFWQPIKQPTFMKRKSFCRKYKYDCNWSIYDYEFWSRTRFEPHFIIGDIVLKYRKSVLNSSIERSKMIRNEHSKIVKRNLLEIGINAPIELCQALDPFNHNKCSESCADIFAHYRPELLKHISQALFDKKYSELILKIK